ncbi:MAG: polyprenyl synthetase family protein [Candidatus Aphodosoma sp.]
MIDPSSRFMTIDDIRASVSSEFIEFQTLFESAFSADEVLIRSVLNHVKNQKGKQVRPLFFILCAKLCGTPNITSYRMATALELLHTASLIHDDVVDNTMVRRNQPSVNKLFENKTAVLAGDYLLSKAIKFASDTDDIRQYKFLSYLGTTLARGELLQLQYAYSIPSEEDYIDVIRKKTAILFDVSAQSAALSVNASDVLYNALHRFADLIGICFQIKDDIFDYTPNAKIGKPTLNDIREGKITLPLLHAMEQLPHSDAISILEAVKNAHFTEDFFYNIGALVAQKGGIEYASQCLDRYKRQAVGILEDAFADSPVRQAMTGLVDYVANRTK